MTLIPAYEKQRHGSQLGLYCEFQDNQSFSKREPVSKTHKTKKFKPTNQPTKTNKHPNKKQTNKGTLKFLGVTIQEQT